MGSEGGKVLVGFVVVGKKSCRKVRIKNGENLGVGYCLVSYCLGNGSVEIEFWRFEFYIVFEM